MLCSKTNRQIPCQKCVEKEKIDNNLYFWFFITFLIKWQGRRQRLLKHFDNVFGPCHQIRVIVIPGGHILVDVVDMRGNPWLSENFQSLVFSEKQNNFSVTRNYFLSLFPFFSLPVTMPKAGIGIFGKSHSRSSDHYNKRWPGGKRDWNSIINQQGYLFYGWVHWVHLQIVLYNPNQQN